MPTNYLRSRNHPSPAGATRPGPQTSHPRIIEITAGSATLRAELLDTPAADRLWRALPLFSTAELWGDSLHFKIPLRSGRERNARLNGEPGAIYFWSHEERILIPYGQTPISRAREIRLPSPCNMLARSLSDTSLLKCVTPGEKVAIKAASNGT